MHRRYPLHSFLLHWTPFEGAANNRGKLGCGAFYAGCWYAEIGRSVGAEGFHILKLHVCIGKPDNKNMRESD